MILENVIFTDLINEIMADFGKNLLKPAFDQIRGEIQRNLEFLAIANLRCYQANMIVIAERKKGSVDHSLISAMELQARVVGEQRVKSKATINLLIGELYPTAGRTSESKRGQWISDDIVYSVGEMLDRLTIETIKRADYAARMAEPGENSECLLAKTTQSNDWSNRVTRYLRYKLEEIHQKGFYECAAETRTYDLSGIQTPEFFANKETIWPIESL